MIIFYDLKTGDITGTIEGRIHDEMHQKMFVGDPKTTGKIVCEWEPTGKETVTFIDQPVFSDVITDDGYVERRETGMAKRKVVTVEYLPEKQVDIFTKLDDGTAKLSDFIVDIKTKKLKPVAKK